jgi:hypothetical protein
MVRDEPMRILRNICGFKNWLAQRTDAPEIADAQVRCARGSIGCRLIQNVRTIPDTERYQNSRAPRTLRRFEAAFHLISETRTLLPSNQKRGIM